jgi:hypothetical protein
VVEALVVLEAVDFLEDVLDVEALASLRVAHLGVQHVRHHLGRRHACPEIAQVRLVLLGRLGMGLGGHCWLLLHASLWVVGAELVVVSCELLHLRNWLIHVSEEIAGLRKEFWLFNLLLWLLKGE